MYFASLREWQETPPSTQTSSRTLKKSSTAPNALPLFASVSQFCYRPPHGLIADREKGSRNAEVFCIGKNERK
jgi:hypothetical protein